MLRRRWQIGLIAGALLVLLGGGLYFYLPRSPRTELLRAAARLRRPAQPLPAVSPKPQPPPPEYAADDAPLYDRRQVAAVLIDALQRYRTDNGEYPPYLLGGDATLVGGFRDAEGGWIHDGAVPSKDPLIAGGYLKQYPFFWPPRDYYLCACSDWPLDARSDERWTCMYSTPGDHAHYPPPRRVLENEPEAHPGPPSVALDWPAALADGRQYALGGRRAPAGSLSQYSLWPGPYIDLVDRMHQLLGSQFPIRPLSFFGYQRGEHLGGSADEAWVWFYGGNVAAAASQLLHEQPGVGTSDDYWYSEKDVDRELWSATCCYEDNLMLRPPEGIDLLNAETGEPVPDGIPDGICLLYKLRGGRLLETTADQLLAPVDAAPSE